MGWILALLGLVFVFGGKDEEELPLPPKPEPSTVFTHAMWTVEVAPYGKGWQWRVWLTYMYEARAGNDVELEKAVLETGEEPTEAAAVQAAKDWIAGQMQGAPSPLVRRGLRLSGDCERIQVVDLEAWIEHAANVVRQEGAELEAGELMAEAFLSVFPECEMETPKIRDRTWAQVEASVAQILDKFRSGKFASIEPPEEAIAARLVGMSAPKREGEAFLMKQGPITYLVVVDRHPNGVWWRAFVWDNPHRDGLPVQAFEQTEQDAAKNLAVQWVEAQ